MQGKTYQNFFEPQSDWWNNATATFNLLTLPDIWFDPSTGQRTEARHNYPEDDQKVGCPYCGFSLRYEDRFCPYCGAPIKA